MMIYVNLEVFGQANAAGYRKCKTGTGPEHPSIIIIKSPSRSLIASDIVSTSNKTKK